MEDSKSEIDNQRDINYPQIFSPRYFAKKTRFIIVMKDIGRRVLLLTLRDIYEKTLKICCLWVKSRSYLNTVKLSVLSGLLY